MRFLKFLSIVLVSLIIILSIIYSARISLIENFSKAKLDSLQLKITCLDFSVASYNTIVVDKVCLQSAKADIDIVNMSIQWQYIPVFIITSIEAEVATIEGTNHLIDHNPQQDPKPSQSINSNNVHAFLVNILRPYADQISQIKLPTKTHITKLFYLPFEHNNNEAPESKDETHVSKIAYQASLIGENNQLRLTLNNPRKINVIKAKLKQTKSGFSLAVNSNFKALKNFASHHKLPISSSLRHRIMANEISGNLALLIQYQDEKLSIENKMTGLLVDVQKGVDKGSEFTLSGALNFNSQISLKSKEKNQADKAITITFAGKNSLGLKYSQENLDALFIEHEISPSVVSMLKDNPVLPVMLNFDGNDRLILTGNKLQLSHVNINAGTSEGKHQLNLANVTIAIQQGDKNAGEILWKSLNVARFNFTNQLAIASLDDFLSAPLKLNLTGKFGRNHGVPTITFNDSSSINMANLAVTANQEDSSPPSLLVNSVTSNLTGSVQLLSDNRLNIDVNLTNYASQVSVPDILTIKTLAVISHIKGSLEDIHIATNVNADGVNLAEIQISGVANSPYVEMSAKKLPLTDLLSLNIKLPVSVKLIDGSLTYYVSGQIDEINKMGDTLFSGSYALTSVSGTVDDIWLQELNWQQDITLLSGIIKSKATDKTNLTIELIELYSSIENLSAKTQWTLGDTVKATVSDFKANAFGGAVSVPDIQWPFEQGHSAVVQLNSIDLEQVLALDKTQGIVVTGNISGELPIIFDGKMFLIAQGELYNVTNGLIQVSDNPAVGELRDNNSQLQLAFDALQNLHYHRLSSGVSMDNDGYMQLDTVVNGRNPDIENDVNLNLNISYDLLGLLASLSITQRFENAIIKDLQKNKE